MRYHSTVVRQPCCVDERMEMQYKDWRNPVTTSRVRRADRVVVVDESRAKEAVLAMR
jgi:hypothetical protein